MVIGMMCLFDLSATFGFHSFVIRLLLLQTGGAFESSEACTGAIGQNSTFCWISCSNRWRTLVSATMYIDNNTSWTGQLHLRMLCFFQEWGEGEGKWVFTLNLLN